MSSWPEPHRRASAHLFWIACTGRSASARIASWRAGSMKPARFVAVSKSSFNAGESTKLWRRASRAAPQRRRAAASPPARAARRAAHEGVRQYSGVSSARSRLQIGQAVRHSNSCGSGVSVTSTANDPSADSPDGQLGQWGNSGGDSGLYLMCPTTGTNLALNRPAIASSTWTSETTPGKAVDGDDSRHFPDIFHSARRAAI